jgi:hypothetical protein
VGWEKEGTAEERGCVWLVEFYDALKFLAVKKKRGEEGSYLQNAPYWRY